ncbi:MAG: hypothetical protein VX640_14600 [Pseudomonadota bacterium]|nr:hypothetical protein [Pseudomonadota bacterium]
MLLYFLGRGATPAWQFATIDLLALIYFYRRWSAPSPQHRQFHFLLMCSYLITTAFYAYQIALKRFAPEALMMSGWWFELFSNILYEAELIGITVYALLFRRAKADRRKFRADVNRWFDGMSAMKQSLLREDRKVPRPDEK